MIVDIQNGLVTISFTPTMCARLAKLLGESDIRADHQDIDDALAGLFKACQHITTAHSYMLREDYQTYLDVVAKDGVVERE
jgi:hypothetical protein